ncbi:hypothetical protein AM501_11320 [Aneurinibacillus migulanus]|uniref:DUF917 domain-containing protein n=1 Tax=Aneurinibacillus migulanus TaxID=47500 RepID=UPI0005BA0448|nr:DUF917 domain-containing protein [Aneurinibacillus migulanus]KIV53853.1 hypothetical protein TS64_18265 [Aneurinibacillus migulanus]KPD08203.1 hypothetical protein AM501_11320 [Aneurinibacillus migulanus]MCP1357095.1 DUF917 domain-containing protein [Aneurinibacillus migulanus]MED4731235.1 DUF917 domain-containing protein [Aneurinibacillus migulanus]CEH30512.1 Uncharacterized protein BN1090_A2_02965 [Aneurinibacillus migulanus]
MRLLGKQEIEDMAVGAALLGTGGGGDPYIGKLMALQAIEEFGPIRLLSIDEVPEDALVVSSGMMGAPTVMVEKAPSGQEAKAAFKTLEAYMGKEIFATYPIEAGGVNSMLPLALAAQLGLPVIDVDGMGRAFPELQMVTFYLDGISASPMVIADEKGNVNLLNTIDNVWAERIARAATIQMGGSVMFAIYPMNGRNLKESGIRNILQLEEGIGRTIRLAKEQNVNPIQEVLKLTKGFELFNGKVVDIHRKTETGFARGTATFEGLGNNKGEKLQLRFQNEHLIATTEQRLLCVTPDLIAVLDEETGLPITTEGLRYGARAVVIGIPCHPKWRTPKGIETCGPGYFGYDVEYVPVEKLAKKGALLG